MHVLLEVVHRGFQSLSLGFLQREHHLPRAGAPLRLLHLLSQLVFLRLSSLRVVDFGTRQVSRLVRWSIDWSVGRSVGRSVDQ